MSNPFPPRRPVYTTQPNSSARGWTKQYDRRQSVIAGHRANAYIQPTALLLFHEGAKLPFLLLSLEKNGIRIYFFSFSFLLETFRFHPTEQLKRAERICIGAVLALFSMHYQCGGDDRWQIDRQTLPNTQSLLHTRISLIHIRRCTKLFESSS